MEKVKADFIDQKYIETLLMQTKSPSLKEIEDILIKAQAAKGLTHQEVASLLQIESEDTLQRLFKVAGEIKKKIYGNRIVLFAPLYISDYCVNNCVYCGYRRDNSFPRRRLSIAEIQEEVKLLEKMGHKRIALEAGEDPLHCDMDYVLGAIDAIYTTENKNGAIRRINVNIAATTVENYREIKERNIGTYILFQETYHRPTYERVHPQSIKGDYDYHTTAFDRAMEAGIEDVGAVSFSALLIINTKSWDSFSTTIIWKRSIRWVFIRFLYRGLKKPGEWIWQNSLIWWMMPPLRRLSPFSG